MSERQLSLLLIDDQSQARELLARRLARDGFQVASADCGETALAMMRVERYDLVLLDLQMPGLDGYALLRCIVSDPQLREAGVIMLTATSARDAVLRCLEAGAMDYIVKPYDFRELKTRIWRAAVARGLAHARRDDSGAVQVAPARVLVVDDQELNRTLLARRAERARRARLEELARQGAAPGFHANEAQGSLASFNPFDPSPEP